MAHPPSSRAAFRDGCSRVLAAPAILAGCYAALFALTGPAAWLVHQGLAAGLGASTIASEVARGGQFDWFVEFTSGATGLASDVAPSTAGFAAVVRNASDLVSYVAIGATERPASASSWFLVFAWWVAGTFLSGGIIDRYARMRPLHARGFFGACGEKLVRLLRLNAMVLVLYWAIAGGYASLAGRVYEWATRDLASERAAFAWALALTLGGALVVAAITIVADCARVRMVIEDRRSAVFALVAGGRFAWRSARAVAMLYLMLGASLAALAAGYAVVAPGAGSPVGWARAGLVIGSAYILGRIFLKLLTYASATSLFQSVLAHAGYVAPPLPVWPESPAIETLGPPPGQ